MSVVYIDSMLYKKNPRLYTYSLDTILTLPSSHFLVGKIPSRPDLSNSSMISHWETTAPILYTCSMISDIVINCASWKDLKRKINEISKDYNELVSHKVIKILTIGVTTKPWTAKFICTKLAADFINPYTIFPMCVSPKEKTMLQFYFLFWITPLIKSYLRLCLF